MMMRMKKMMIEVEVVEDQKINNPLQKEKVDKEEEDLCK
jgi:hypothetical protein